MPEHTSLVDTARGRLDAAEELGKQIHRFSQQEGVVVVQGIYTRRVEKGRAGDVPERGDPDIRDLV
jgi:hypothetical protein